MTELTITPDFRPLGKSGLSVFPIAYGMWRFAGTSPEVALAKLNAALDVGITLFDTADIYGVDGGGSVGDSEKLFGKAVALDKSMRDRMVIATKGGIVIGLPYDSTQEHLTKTCEASLQRMGIEQIDLFQIHRPDLLAHPAVVAETLTTLRQQGKIAHVGVSNHTASQFDALQEHLDFPIVTHQPELSCWVPGALFDGVLDQSMQHDVTPLAWSPLAGGKLALGVDDVGSGDHADRLTALICALEVVAVEAGVTRDVAALAWLLAHPSGIIPIIGTQNLGRISATRDVFKVKFTRETWYEVLQASMGERLP